MYSKYDQSPYFRWDNKLENMSQIEYISLLEVVKRLNYYKDKYIDFYFTDFDEWLNNNFTAADMYYNQFESEELYDDYLCALMEDITWGVYDMFVTLGDINHARV